MVGQEERRAHPRYSIDCPISLSPADLARVFGGRGQNLSHSGALVALPLSIPLRPGQDVEVKLHPRPNPMLTGGASQHAEVRNARVVRVQRGTTLFDGLQLVGLTFDA